ncbi:unnamed protein product [Pedinophyceae sp. YPF-701]|nr:unnamed protein product [Pedinophyceae sp. YPF-701]
MAGPGARGRLGAGLVQVLYVVVALLALAPSTQGIVLKVVGRECVYKHADAGQQVSGTFVSMSRVGARQQVPALIVTATGPQGEAVFSALEREGEFQFLAPQRGKFRVCVGPQDKALQAREIDVAVEVFVGHLHHAVSGADKAGVEDTQALRQVVDELSNTLSTVRAEQRYVLRRKERQYKTLQSTHRRALIGACGKLAVMVAVFVLQILVVRWMFTTKFGMPTTRTPLGGFGGLSGLGSSLTSRTGSMGRLLPGMGGAGGGMVTSSGAPPPARGGGGWGAGGGRTYGMSATGPPPPMLRTSPRTSLGGMSAAAQPPPMQPPMQPQPPSSRPAGAPPPTFGNPSAYSYGGQARMRA